MKLRDRPLILHVLESYGAGSARAAEGYATALPEFRHVVLRHLRDGESVEGQEHAAFDDVLDLPASPPAAVRVIRRVVRDLEPDRVHAHSSYAGAYVRVALPRHLARSTVVYTPHCFAFERQDLPRVVREGVRRVERLLAPRTAVIAACSTRELELAEAFGAGRAPVLVPNAASARTEQTGVSTDLLGIGRLGPQKDPELFARVAIAALRTGITARARWVGDGVTRSVLERCGVEVTGWRSADEVAEISAEPGVYLHTALWEGFPLAVLEADAAGLPIVARRIPAMAGMPTEWLFDDVDEALRLLGSLADPGTRARNRAAWSTSLARNTAAEQRRALLEAYDLPIAA